MHESGYALGVPQCLDATTTGGQRADQVACRCLMSFPEHVEYDVSVTPKMPPVSFQGGGAARRRVKAKHVFEERPEGRSFNA